MFVFVFTLLCQELRLVFPALLQSIFGGEAEPGWGVDKLCKSQHAYDFEAMRTFLGPEGPLLNAVYSLQADPYTAYEFPFKCLPVSWFKNDTAVSFKSFKCPPVR